jgi:hypothetical protein
MFHGNLWDSITSSDLNPGNWSVGGQNLGLGTAWDNTFGNEGVGGVVNSFLEEPAVQGSSLNPNNWSVGGQNLGNLWDNTMGNQGLGGLLTGANPSVGGFVGGNLGPVWDQTYGNQGVGGWLQSLLGGGPGGAYSGGQGGGSSGGPMVPGGFNLGKQSGGPGGPYSGGQGGGGGRMRTPLGQNPFEKGPLGNLFRGQQSSGRSIRPRTGY